MAVELTNHIWQSTVFAMAVALMTLGFRKDRAQVRYWLWLSASLKFLLPFSLLVYLGNHVQWAPAAQTAPAPAAITLSLLQMAQPFSGALPRTRPTPDARDWAGMVLLGVWACGFAAIALTRVRDWRRIRAAIRNSIPVDILGCMQIRASPGLLEPGVVGLFRPVLLLPADLSQRLKPSQFQAVLAHEMCHVRRRDNLTSAIHMLVEAVFWFHPLVWWIGARMMEERERACDEAVLSLGTERHDYAEGILSLCKSYVESPLSFVSGVTSSNLKKRIQAILAAPIAREPNLAKKVILASAAVAAVTIPFAVGMLGAPAGRAQSQSSFTQSAATPKFAAASIKPCDAFRKGTVAMRSPGKLLQSQCTTVQRLIQQAYGLFGNGHWNLGSSLAVIGGPAWTRSDLYEVDAQAATPQSRAMMNGPMLQALLEDRLKLRVHLETRAIPVYALAVAEGGPKLQPFEGSCVPRDFDKPPSPEDCAVARGYGNGFDMKAATVADLCTGFSVLLDRPVIDKTGLAGRFTMRVDLSSGDGELLNRPRSLPALADPTAPAPEPVLFDTAKSAMKKLGLTLKPATGPSEFIAIDHVDRPSGT
jgi:bla regulator protein BlaR1